MISKLSRDFPIGTEFIVDRADCGTRIINLSIPVDLSSVVDFGDGGHMFLASIQMRLTPKINIDKFEYLIDVKIDSVDFDVTKMNIKDAALIKAIDNFNFCGK